MSIISSKDWHDFWYKSEDIMTPSTNNNYNELVDYQVHSMNRFESLSDTMTTPTPTTETNNQDQEYPGHEFQDYADYKNKVKQYQLNTNENLTEMILKIGFQIDQSLDKIIKTLDKLVDKL